MRSTTWRSAIAAAVVAAGIAAPAWSATYLFSFTDTRTGGLVSGFFDGLPDAFDQTRPTVYFDNVVATVTQSPLPELLGTGYQDDYRHSYYEPSQDVFTMQFFRGDYFPCSPRSCSFPPTNYEYLTANWKPNSGVPGSISIGYVRPNPNGGINEPRMGAAVGSDDFTLTRYVAPAAPEPGAWAMLIAGFGIAGGALRARRRGHAIA